MKKKVSCKRMGKILAVLTVAVLVLEPLGSLPVYAAEAAETIFEDPGTIPVDETENSAAGKYNESADDAEVLEKVPEGAEEIPGEVTETVEMTPEGAEISEAADEIDSEEDVDVGISEFDDQHELGNLQWEINYRENKLTISGSGEMQNFTSSSKAPWYEWQRDIYTVEIESGVTSIGDYAFNGCNRMEGIVIPDSVTSLGDYAFSGCTGLRNINIPDKVTKIGSYAFNSCYVLPEIEIPGSVTSFGAFAFTRCSELKSVKILPGVKSIGDNAFHFCNKLTSVELPAGLISIGGSAFASCASLSAIELPAGLTSIGGGAFSSCEILASVNIPDSVTSMGDAFRNCTSLTSIELPDGVTKVKGFAGCTSLESVKMSANVTSIEDSAFQDCEKLKTIQLSNGTTGLPGGLESIGSLAFLNCKSLESIDIPATVKKIYFHAFRGCSGLTSITVAGENANYSSDNGCNTITEKRYGGKYLLFGCQNTVIPDDVVEIEEYAFENQSQLKKIHIPASVTTICTGAFDGCSGLEQITVDENNTEYDSRKDCNALIWTNYNEIMYGCQNTLIPNDVVEIRAHAFENQTGLKRINIPASVTTIGTHAFYGCTGLEEITVDDGNTKYDSRNNCNAIID